MNYTQEVYYLNRSELRGLARFPSSGESRHETLQNVCRSLRFWYGDSFSPAHPGVLAALRTYDGSMRFDLYEAIAIGIREIPPEQRVQFLKLTRQLGRISLHTISRSLP